MVAVRAEKYWIVANELETCSFVGKEARKMVLEFLDMEGIASLQDVDEMVELRYRRYIQENQAVEENKKWYVAAALESCVRFCLQSQYADLEEELQEYGKLCKTQYDKTLQFLIVCKLHRLDDIDISVRQRYQYFLEESGNVQAQQYLKIIDQLKLYAISKKQGIRALGLVFAERPLYLGYHPDYRTAMEFYYTQNKEELLFDFSLPAARRMKKQVFLMLNHALNIETTRKLRRELYLLPLRRLYLYCVEQNIEDIERMELCHIEGFRASMDGNVGTKTDIYMQIVNNIRKFLFVNGTEINWSANVWYMERFHLEGRVNPATPVDAIRFYEILDWENRRLAKIFFKYQLSRRLAMNGLRMRHYNIQNFLKYCDTIHAKAVSVTSEDMRAYIESLDKGILPDTFNQKLTDLEAFFEFLCLKKYREEMPFYAEFYYMKVIPNHHERTVPLETQAMILKNLKYFPETLRLMYLHLWAVGLRINEVCCIRGDAYTWEQGVAWIKIYQYKSQTEKKVPIPDALYDLMVDYLKKHGRSAEDYAFQRENGGAYGSQTFTRQMKKLLKKYGIVHDGFFRPHDYRHSVATMLYENGASLQTIRDYLGHSETDMTAQYIDQIPKQIDAANEQFFEAAPTLLEEMKERSGK